MMCIRVNKHRKSFLSVLVIFLLLIASVVFFFTHFKNGIFSIDDDFVFFPKQYNLGNVRYGGWSVLSSAKGVQTNFIDVKTDCTFEVVVNDGMMISDETRYDDGSNSLFPPSAELNTENGGTLYWQNINLNDEILFDLKQTFAEVICKKGNHIVGYAVICYHTEGAEPYYGEVVESVRFPEKPLELIKWHNLMNTYEIIMFFKGDRRRADSLSEQFELRQKEVAVTAGLYNKCRDSFYQDVSRDFVKKQIEKAEEKHLKKYHIK